MLADCEGRAGADPDRHRQRGAAGAGRPRDADRRGHPLARGQPALLGDLRPPGRRPTATRCCRRRSPPGSRSRRPRPLGWERYVGTEGAIIGMTTFGQSAPFADVEAEFGFTAGATSPRWRARSPRARPTNQRPEEVAREGNRTTARAGAEPLARQHHPHDARRRHPAGLHRRALGHRPDLEPDDLRQGDLRRRRLRRADRRGQRRRRGRRGRRRQRRRARLLRARRSPTCRTRPTSSPPSTSAPTGSTASARWRSRRCWPTTPRRRSSRPRRCTPRPSARTSSSRSPAPRPAATAIEESIFAGIPINVTLLFDDRQYLGAAEAYMRGIERRIEAGLDPAVASVASIFMSRWDVAVAEEVPDELHNRLGIAVGGRAYVAYRELLDSTADAAADERGRAAAAAALGQHRDQGPERLRHALHRGLRLALHGQHDAGADPARLRRPRRGRRPDGGRRRQLRAAAEGVRARPGSTSPRSPTGSRTRAKRASTSPGKSC